MAAALLEGGCWKCWMALEMSKERRGIPWMETCGWADACGSTVCAWCRVPHVPAFQSIRTSHQFSGFGLNHVCLVPAHPTLLGPDAPAGPARGISAPAVGSGHHHAALPGERQAHVRAELAAGAGTGSHGACMLAVACKQPEGRWHMLIRACQQGPFQQSWQGESHAPL